MRKVSLENIEIDLKEQLKDKEFKRLYEIECAKVALAQKIAQLRQDKHLKQVDLAKKLGVTQQFISQIETAEEKNLTIETLIKIAKSLGRGVKISFPKLSGQNPSYLKVT
ncbi:MAG: helix-turn-helix domain-containing protein [Candidatus Omnitrophica bacterium]|nr:helix-turn-helix domain-containing protein [Candidatus Omnitrophota bacterium]MBU4473530.1 helix-turn-helix domain-containing protein [Candidatus Omnitrophota bacterium]MCG2706169.1 helix-turn-helix domain-containing protein [Candidatus Omnitrophota bacterium]